MTSSMLNPLQKQHFPPKGIEPVPPASAEFELTPTTDAQCNGETNHGIGNHSNEEIVGDGTHLPSYGTRDAAHRETAASHRKSQEF